MKRIVLEVLSDETNASVVRMPGRRYPGLVVQGDKLICLSGAATELYDAASKASNEEQKRLAGNLRYEIRELLERYSAACRGFNPDSDRQTVDGE
jgi:hypothetical protein